MRLGFFVIGVITTVAVGALYFHFNEKSTNEFGEI